LGGPSAPTSKGGKETEFGYEGEPRSELAPPPTEEEREAYRAEAVEALAKIKAQIPLRSEIVPRVVRQLDARKERAAGMAQIAAVPPASSFRDLQDRIARLLLP
jgi:hypothetical protein